MRITIPLIVFLLLPLSGEARKIGFDDCSAESRGRIKAAVQWLVARLPDLDQQLGRGGLANWSGKSRDRFARRLLKGKLRFTCHKDCTAPRFSKIQIGDWSLPIAHGSKIPVCTRPEYDTAKLAAMIGHGLGHLVWINAHRRTCHERCTQPRLGTSLLYATHHVALGSVYEATYCMAACGAMPGASAPVEDKAAVPPVDNAPTQVSP